MIKFQSAGKSDISLLQQLAHTIWHSHYPGIITVEQIEFMLSNMYSASQISKELDEGYYWVIIISEQQPVGFLSYHVEDQKKCVKLNKLYVLVAYHGKGIGQAALEYVKEEAKRLKANKLYLAVNKQNVKAIQAYRKAGFASEKEVVTEIGNGYVMDDYIMSVAIE